jgi:hypothetical protein
MIAQRAEFRSQNSGVRSQNGRKMEYEEYGNTRDTGNAEI